MKPEFPTNLFISSLLPLLFMLLLSAPLTGQSERDGFSQNPRLKPYEPDGVQATVPYPSALSGRWDFNEGSGSLIFDATSNNNHGTLIGGVQWHEEPSGSVLGFDGIDDYAVVPAQPSLCMCQDSFSVAAWVAVVSWDTPSYAGIVQHGSPFSNGYGLSRYSDTDSIRFGVGTNCVPEWSDFKPEPYEWYHLVGIRKVKGSLEDIYLYVDGILFQSRLDLPLTDLSLPQPLYFGGNADMRFFNGRIDNVRIYRKALSFSEIQAISSPSLKPSAIPLPNQAPEIFDLAPVQVLEQPESVLTLSGSARDDGLPEQPGMLLFTWSQVSGPSAAVIETPHAQSTQVSIFSQGEFVFRFSVYDGELTAEEDVVVYSRSPSFFPGTVYYVDSKWGDDSHSGLSEAFAWKTIEKVNSWFMKPGDAVLFKAGRLWRELLKPQSGDASNPVTYGTFGSGPLPTISAADDYSSSSTYQWTLSDYGINEFFLEAEGGGDPKIAAKVLGLWLNQEYLSMGVLGELEDRQWAFGDHDDLGFETVYLRDDLGDPDVTQVLIEGSQRSSAVRIDHKSDVTLQYLRLKHNNLGYRGVLHVNDSERIKIERSVLEESSLGHVSYLLRTDASSIAECVIRYQRGLSGTTLLLESSNQNAISRNALYHNSNPMGDIIFLAGSSENIIENNYIAGPAANGVYTRIQESERNVIRRNFIHDIQGIGIQCRDGCRDSEIYYNVLIDNDGPAIQSDGLNGSGASGNKIRNNFIYCRGSANGIHIFAKAGENYGVEVMNNLVMSDQGDCFMIDENSHLSGAISDHNLFYKYGTSGSYLLFAGQNYSSLAAFQAASGQDLHSLDINPQIQYVPPSSPEDAKLTALSPCIDKGIFVGILEDYFGNEVPNGIVDIGVHEF